MPPEKRRPFTPTCAGAVIQCRTVLYVYVTFESWSNGVLQLEMDMQSKATLPGVGTTEQKKTTIYYVQSLTGWCLLLAGTILMSIFL